MFRKRQARAVSNNIHTHKYSILFLNRISFTHPNASPSRYLIVKKTDTMPRFDNRFVNYGYNKVQWVTHLRFSGYHFYVFGPAFGIDVAHPRYIMRES